MDGPDIRSIKISGDSPSRFASVVCTPWTAAAVGLVCFLSTLGGDFTYDDKFIVRDNPNIRSLTNQRAIWLSDWWDIPSPEGSPAASTRDRLYRPLTLLTFAFDYQLAHAVGNGPPTSFVFHLTNVLLHAVACALVWVVLRRLLESHVAATAGALLFAVHPVHCEAVAGIVGRAEILTTIFLCAGMAALGRGPVTNVRRALTACLFFVLALFSKETAVCYLGVALIWIWRFQTKPQPWRFWLKIAATLAIPLAVYFPLRFMALDFTLLRHEFNAVLFNPVGVAERSDRWIAPLTILGYYMQLLLFPLRLSCEYGFGVIDLRGLDGHAVAGIAFVLFVCVALWRGWRTRGARRTAAALTAMLVVSYALISNAFLLIGVALAERLMYWPSVPAIALMVVGGRAVLDRLVTKMVDRNAKTARFVAIGVLLAAITCLGGRSVLRNSDWATEERLFAADLAENPRSAQLLAGVASVHTLKADQLLDFQAARRELRAADRLLERSLRVFHPNAYALHLRAQIRYRLLDPIGARALLVECVQLQNTPADALAFLKRLDAAGITVEQRLATIHEQLQQYPDDPTPHQRLGDVMLSQGDAAGAIGELQTAVKLDPDDVETQYLLGVALHATGDVDGAIRAWRRAIALDPENSAALGNLAVALSAKDMLAALDVAQRAVRVAPNDADARETYADLLNAAGKRPEALREYRAIAKLLVDDAARRAHIEQRIRTLESTP